MGRLVLVVCLLLLAPRGARADAVDDLISEMSPGASKQRRLRAALSLVKTGDPRAIRAYVSVGLTDSDDSIRGLSTLALAKLVDVGASAADRQRAKDALARAARQDKSARVRKYARRALQRIIASSPAVPPPCVAVGPVSCPPPTPPQPSRSTSSAATSSDSDE